MKNRLALPVILAITQGGRALGLREILVIPERYRSQCLVHVT